MNLKTKKYILTYTIIIGIIIECYLWFNCNNYCISIIKVSYLSIIQTFSQFIKKGLIIFILFILFKIIQHVFINNIVNKIMQKLNTDRNDNKITKILNLLLWSLFVFLTIYVLIGDITPLLTSLGLVGFGLTFALQKPILNFVGWLTIIFNDVYHEGDRIQINNVIGDVKEIQIMNTIVEGLLQSSDVLSGKTISFPNELILSTDVQNYTKDSNYIVTELSISITYESDYHKAMKMLKDIIILQVTTNKKKYIKRITKQNIQLNNYLNQWMSSSTPSKKNDDRKEQLDIEKIKQQKEDLENDLKSLEEEFIPLIRIELLDSAINLIAQFKAPYDEIKKNRTDINIAFLDAVKKESEIEIAYPHMQLVADNKK